MRREHREHKHRDGQPPQQRPATARRPVAQRTQEGGSQRPPRLPKATGGRATEHAQDLQRRVGNEQVSRIVALQRQNTPPANQTPALLQPGVGVKGGSGQPFSIGLGEDLPSFSYTPASGAMTWTAPKMEKEVKWSLAKSMAKNAWQNPLKFEKNQYFAAGPIPMVGRFSVGADVTLTAKAGVTGTMVSGTPAPGPYMDETFEEKFTLGGSMSLTAAASGSVSLGVGPTVGVGDITANLIGEITGSASASTGLSFEMVRHYNAAGQVFYPFESVANFNVTLAAQLKAALKGALKWRVLWTDGTFAEFTIKEWNLASGSIPCNIGVGLGSGKVTSTAQPSFTTDLAIPDFLGFSEPPPPPARPPNEGGRGAGPTPFVPDGGGGTGGAGPGADGTGGYGGY